MQYLKKLFNKIKSYFTKKKDTNNLKNNFYKNVNNLKEKKKEFKVISFNCDIDNYNLIKDYCNSNNISINGLVNELLKYSLQNLNLHL